MKFGVVNKSTTVNRFFLHTIQSNITHLDVIISKTNIKLGILKGGNWKRAKFTYRLIWPRQTYLVFILNLVKPLVKEPNEVVLLAESRKRVKLCCWPKEREVGRYRKKLCS